MGWLTLAVFGGAAFAGLRLFGVPARFGWAVGAALMLGAAGYALQQHAGLKGQPVSAAAEAIDVDPEMAAFREAILPSSDETRATLAAVDAQMRAGEREAAVRRLLAAIAKRPGDAALWTGLGSTLVDHDGGQLSPAAQLAFRRAWQLAPRAPGPPFFLGLALVQSGDLAAAKIAWLRALALTPPGAPYRLDIAERLALLDQFQAMAAAGPKP